MCGKSNNPWIGKVRQLRGFSLIEVLIVSVILSILAGIALISVQYIMENARKKAAIAEARRISTAMEFAHQETGFFPKFNYLIERLRPYTAAVATGDGVVDAAGNVWKGWDYNGALDPTANVYRTYNRRIQEGWNGPYWAQSPTNKSTAEGPAGFVEMQIPDRNNEVRRWPVDQWGRPYVLYLLEQYEDTNTNPSTQKVRFMQNPAGEPNYACAVVSYGSDGLPGVQIGAGAAEVTRKQGQCLFVELVAKRVYRMLSLADYDVNTPAGQARMEGYSEKRFKNIPGYTGAALGDLVGCTDFVPLPNGYLTSDDVVIEF